MKLIGLVAMWGKAGKLSNNKQTFVLAIECMFVVGQFSVEQYVHV